MKTPIGFRYAGIEAGIKPSRKDLARNFYGEAVVHFIISLQGDAASVRAWRLGAETYREARQSYKLDLALADGAQIDLLLADHPPALDQLHLERLGRVAQRRQDVERVAAFGDFNFRRSVLVRVASAFSAHVEVEAYVVIAKAAVIFKVWISQGRAADWIVIIDLRIVALTPAVH